MGVSRRTAKVDFRAANEVSRWCSSCYSVSTGRPRPTMEIAHLELGLNISLDDVYGSTHGLEQIHLVAVDVPDIHILCCQDGVLFQQAASR